MRNLLEDRQRFHPRGVGFQLREVGQRNQPRMGIAEEAQHHGHRYVGMAEIIAEPPGAGSGGAVCFKHGQNRRDLLSAAADPEVGDLVVQAPFVEQADDLVAEAYRQGSYLG